MELDFKIAEKKIKDIISKNQNSDVLQEVVNFLYNNFHFYDWVGIYLVEGDFLILRSWNGKQATDHTKIPIGNGICGSAAKSGKTEMISDVSKDDRYLACFVSTRSEIVVPIIKDDEIIGEIDIDSDVVDAFNKNDKIFLEKIADMLSKHIC